MHCNRLSRSLELLGALSGPLLDPPLKVARSRSKHPKNIKLSPVKKDSTLNFLAEPLFEEVAFILTCVKVVKIRSLLRLNLLGYILRQNNKNNAYSLKIPSIPKETILKTIINKIQKGKYD